MSGAGGTGPDMTELVAALCDLDQRYRNIALPLGIRGVRGGEALLNGDRRAEPVERRGKSALGLEHLADTRMQHRQGALPVRIGRIEGFEALENCKAGLES